MDPAEQPEGEERSEIEREREEPDEEPKGVEDESGPWAKLSTGRDPDE